MFRKNLVVLFLAALLYGCTSPFAQFYYDQTGGADLSKSPFVVFSTGEPIIYRGSNLDQEALKMLEENYSLVGYSSFNAGNVNEKDAITQEKKVNASIAIVYSKYTGTETGSLPLTLPDTKTSSTSFYGNAYGSGGYGTYSGTVNTTTYGTTTTYIPYTIHRSDYLVTYWIKRIPPVFGVHIRDLTPEIKQQIGSNKGMLIFAVIKGSPAFDADILKGDVLRRIGEVVVFDMETFAASIAKNEGRETDVVLFRGDREIQKSVRFSARN